MSKIAKITLILMLITMLSKISGFSREIVLAYAYGTTTYSDAYIVAMNIPNVIFAGIGSAIATTFIPIFCEISSIEGKDYALTFSNSILNIIIILGTILSILGFLFSKQIVKVFAMGFSGQILELATNLNKVMMLGIVFIGVSHIMKAYLNINGSFGIPAFIVIPYNLIIIISIFLSVKLKSYNIITIGTIIAIISQAILQLPFAIKKGYRYKIKINIKDKYIKKLLWLIGPVFIGVTVDQLNVLVDRTLASTLAEGSIAALNYANKLNMFIMGLFIVSVSSVIYPKLSKLSSTNSMDEFRSTIITSINGIIILVLPITVGAIVLCTPIVKLLFERGAFDNNATRMTSSALVFYSIGIIGLGLRDILGKVFYSLQDTKTPMINGAISMVINIILNLILVRFMGHNGLALATSISAIICIILLFRSLKFKIGDFGQDKIAKTLIKSTIASITMGLCTYFTYNVIGDLLKNVFGSNIISLFGAMGTGVIIYLILIVILRVEEIYMIWNIVKFRINKKFSRENYVN
ncbi:murein biosynthesis integral membrane protein MurJ [Paraclostridium sordellii]|uniref:murein biosynthesis integral membrane protein MurJ n=1 Tax=Paraclostridium sordellii TaxID=1505 RepID=UPI0005DD02EC|nr:murein biosynthesis integral membrane protein MurJ [Paeniclostridium sordellii]CEN89199.1 virulence factor MviN [[Clostridium] sordellii] [Paeniclostridium sordellii]CEQ13048.1 virulence factor MviN [[Clostridium] sordellii] [Paeniclostridium sordellii]